MGEWVRRQQFRAVSKSHFECSDELFFGGPDVGAYSATYGLTDAGAQYINRPNSDALHPAVSTTLTGAHINTDDAAVSRADVAALARTDLRDLAAYLGADVITNFRAHNLADAAADSSPGARTVASTNRATLADANHSTLATSQ